MRIYNKKKFLFGVFMIILGGSRPRHRHYKGEF